jgi:protocatechuate 3,4-dioxygenase beta subunit
VHPAGWLDGKDTPGDHGGTADPSPPGDRIFGAVVDFGDHAVEYNFGELLPGSIRGNVHASPGPDCIFAGELPPCIGFDSGGSITYNSATNRFSLNALLTSLETGELFTAGNVNLQILVNEAGLLVGGVAGNDLTLIGELDLDGDFIADISGTLLTAEVIAFASTDAGSTDTYKLRFQITGGLLASQYAGDDLIVKVTSENSNFTGNFVTDFSGGAKGEICTATLEEAIPLEGVQIDLLDANGNLIRSTFTDVNGDYEFTGLRPGTYQVREHQPVNYYDGGEFVGTLGGASHDVAEEFSVFTGIDVGSDEHGIYYDFCEKIGVTLSGNVYHDRSNDGIFNRTSEQGIENVVLKLFDAAGNDTGLRATTNSAGYYEFTNLRAGAYSVVEVHPAGWLDGIDTPGNLGGVADNPPPGDMLSQITINWGQTGVEYNFGELLPGSIHGRVIAHSGPECDFDNPEVLLAGVRIDLLDGSGHVIATTFTNTAGEYEFAALRPGTYGVRENQPAGYFDSEERVGTAGGLLSANDVITSIVLPSAVNATQYDFCEELPASIRGRVIAHSGQECDFDNPQVLLAGVVIELRDGAGNLVATTTTDENGEYIFENLEHGEYQVHEIQPAGYYDGEERVGTAGGLLDGIDTIFNIHLEAGMHATQYDFCEELPASIRGRVSAHTDEECDFDQPEILLAGVVIELRDGAGHVVATTTTDENGEYVFEDLEHGVYQVHEIQPPAYYDGEERVGTAGGLLDGIDTIFNIHLEAGMHATQYDFCEHVGVTLSGNVYHDRSNDGVFDRPGEEGIGNVELRLLDAAGNDTGRRAFTNSAGYYEFTNLRAGTYSVVEVHPAGWLDGIDTPGNLTGVADVSPPGDRISQITIHWGETGIEYNFGELLPGSIRGRVHADHHEDCDFDDPEILLEGVQIDLLDGDGNLITFTFTNELGEYEFTGLRPGIYQVREHQPAEYFDGGERIGTLGGAKHDVAEVFSVFTGIDVGSGQNGIHYDFCEKVGVTLSGNVYHDRSNDGIFNRTSEAGIGNVVLKLLDAAGNDTGLRATTNSAGYYEFTNLRAGTYSVVELHPAGWLDGIDTPGNLAGVADASPGGDRISQITIHWGETGIEYNFGELLPGSIRGRVHADDGPDCNFDDPHHMLEGVRIDLLDSSGNVIATTLTNADGEYEFTGLVPGTYSVREHDPAEYFDGGERVGTLGGASHDVAEVYSFFTAIHVGSDQHGINYDFCEKPPASIRGRVHADDEPECNFDDPHVFLEGVRIDLLDAAGNLVATTFTNAAGEYEFTNLRQGTYSVREHQPVDHFDGGERIGTSGGNKHDVEGEFSVFTDITLEWGEDATQYDFCEKPPAELSGYVYIDGAPIVLDEGETLTPHQIAALRDGVRTPDDTPIPGVLLELRQGASGDPILVHEALAGYYSGAPDDPIRVVTDANGFYLFAGLPAGTYAVVQIQPDGVIDNVDAPGTLGGFAVNPAGLSAGPGGPPPIGVQSNIEQFRTQFGNNAIMRIPLPVGQRSQENNFSEVVTTSPPPPEIPEPPEPPLKPPVFGPPGVPFVPPLVFAPIPRTNPAPDIFGGSSQVLGFTWHLSVVNAGWPRSMMPTEARFQLTSAHIDAAAWMKAPLDGSHWTLATVNGSNVVVLREETFGSAKALPVTGDFNGDGIADLGVFIDGQWFLDLNGNGVWDEGDLWAQLGSQDDLPVTGDWDADGKTDIGIYGPAWPRDPWAIEREPGLPDADNFPTRPPGKMKNVPPTADEATDGARLLKRTATGKSRADLIDHVFHYGAPNDVPVTGDWNGDGIRQIGVFRDGKWNLDLDGDGRFTEVDEIVAFGRAGDRPVVGDFNGDGIDEVGVFRAGQWLIDTNHNREIDAQDKVFELGGAGDVPVVGDWNDDGTDDPGVYQPGTATDRVARRAG